MFLEKAIDPVHQVLEQPKINGIKQIWLVQTRRRNTVKPVKHVFLMIDIKTFKHATGVVRFTLATFISCIISGPVAVGIVS